MSRSIRQYAGLNRFPRCAKRGVEIRACILEIGGVVADTETHLGGLRGNPQFRHQADEVGVGTVVVDDEAGIDGIVPAVKPDIDRRCMAACTRFCLEDHDLMAAGQQPRSAQPGDAGADDRDSHL
jgi:hypothetical protein